MVALVLVGMALAAGIVSQLLPMAERHPQQVADWLGGQVNRKVHFDHLETQWTRRGPLLRLDGLRIGEGDNTLPIGTAEILVAQYAGLLPGRSFTELRLRGLDLRLVRDDDGQWEVRGLPGRSDVDPFAALEGLGELQIIGAKLQIDAPAHAIHARIEKIDLRLRVDDDRVRVGARAWINAKAAPIEVRLDFMRTPGDGRAYVVASEGRLADWSSLLHFAGVAVEGGEGRAQAWAEIKGKRISNVTVDTVLRDVRLRGIKPGNASSLADSGGMQVGFDRVEARGSWLAKAGDWRFDAARLRMGDEKQMQVLDGLTVAGGQRYGLLAHRIDAGPLLAVIALSDRLSPGMQGWLVRSAPRAILHDVEIMGSRGGSFGARGRVEELQFLATGHAPGISGINGVIDGDDAGMVFTFDESARSRFDWPAGFGVVHDIVLRGSVAGWHDQAGWHVETPALRVAGSNFGADARAGIVFQGDGTRPILDIAAHIDPARVPVAKGFWVRYLMSPGLVQWLDAALVDGRIVDGRAVVSGDLDDWPFRQQADGSAAKGLFRAEVTVADATLKFQPDWPAAEHFAGDIRFVADSFHASGNGQFGGVPVATLTADIPHFGKQSELAVRAQGQSDAGKLLAMLKQTPLHASYADTLDNLSANGKADVTFGLDLPLHREEGKKSRISGTVDLAGATLEDARWKLRFNDVRGAARYDGNGFAARDLRVVHAGQPGVLSLRAGPGHVRDADNSFEAALAASLDTDELLDYVPDLAWLKSHVNGLSPWTVAVSIPRVASQRSGRPTPTAPAVAATRLQLQSNLVGTRLSLPVPLDKLAATPLATTIETLLPFGQGDINVAFGQRMALRARSSKDRIGIRAVLGSNMVAEAPPSSGLVASGHTPSLDAIDWMALTTASPGDGLQLRHIDVTTDGLLLLGSRFANTRLQVDPVAGGIQAQVDGPSLSGTVVVPRADGARITGRFTRAYWKSAGVGAPSASTEDNAAIVQRPGTDLARASTAGGAEPGTDPARIPPLDMEVDDLRFGNARLGKSSLRTRPSADGMQIEQLQMRAPKQVIDITGNWTGRGQQARTRLVADVGSQDFGALMTGLGLGNRLASGHGEVHFDAGWPGTPAGFALTGLEGTLSATLKDGQLVELEPGAGRVLGLFSLTQLPRRLMLDFSDLFAKGFSFNQIKGTLRFGNGQARTDDSVIEGPAAEIRIRGSADLRAQTFDQTIDVLPNSGNLLTVAGAIAGGPVGAAVGAVANAVLKKPLSEISSTTYHVTGPWKEPKVDVVTHAPATPATPASSGTPAAPLPAHPDPAPPDAGVPATDPAAGRVLQSRPSTPN